MFSFFRRKSAKLVPDGDGDTKRKSITENTNEKVQNRDGNGVWKQQTGAVPYQDNIREQSPVENEKDEVKNNLMRRDSKTSKEVVNLLLPEDVKYKKDSYLSGVQSLLDIMGRRRNKSKKKSKTWTFGANRTKEDEKKLASDDKNINYISSNVFAQANDEYEDAVEDLKSFNNNNELGDTLGAMDLIDGRVQPSDVLSCEFQKSAGESERADEEVGRLTSADGNCAKDEIGEGGRWYFGDEDHQSGTKRDTGRPQLTCEGPEAVGDPDTAPPSSHDAPRRSSRIDCESVVLCENSSVSDAFNLDTPVRENVVEDKVEGQMGSSDSKQNGRKQEKESASVKVEPDLVLDSKVSEPIKEQFSRSSPERVTGLVSVCDIGNQLDDMATQTITLVSTSQEDAPVVKGSLNLEIMKLKKDVIETSLGRPLNGIVVGSSTDKPKNILKEEKLSETPSSVKKHVTFQNFIEFDDGGRIEDDAADDESFASLEEESEENSVFQIEVDNNENVDSEEETHGEIVEFEDTSSSEEANLDDKMKRSKFAFHSSSIKRDNSLDSIANSILIEELEVENDENIGFERDSDSDFSDLCVVEPVESKKDNSKTEEYEVVSESQIIPDKQVEIVKESSDEDEEEDEDLDEEEEEEEIEEEEEEEEEVIEVKEEPKTEQIIVTKDEVENKIEVEIEKSNEEVEDEEEEEEDDDEEEYTSTTDISTSDDVNESNDKNEKLTSEVQCDVCANKEEENQRRAKEIFEGFRDSKDEESAYSELLMVLEKQMRGLVGQDNRFTELQERAAALHRVQNEVCSARKEAELVRQKLWHVEADLTATRCRNSQLLEQMEAKTEEVKEVEKRVTELTEEAARLQEHLDKLIPENERLKEKYKILKEERDSERKMVEETLAQASEERQNREEWWKVEFERLRSQGAEREELLLADCEWKLREVQQAAREKGALAEKRLKEVQKQADERCAQADSHLAELTELRSLQAEVTQLRQAAREQQRALRLAAERASHAAQAESEAARLRTLLDREKNALGIAKAQHTKELEEKENRLLARLQEQEARLENEWKQKIITEEQEKRLKEQTESCRLHEDKIREAYDRLEILKSQLAKKEAQYEENLQKEKTRADWELLELRRMLDKTEIKYSEEVEKLEEKFARETEIMNEEMEKKIRELETALSTQAMSARTTLELVKGQLKADHSESIQKLREKHKSDMEKQWDIFTADKEQCLERMKAECILESEEEREKRDKELTKDIENLKNELTAQESDLGTLRHDARKANEARVIAEKKLSELQVASEAREMAIRSEITRQSEVAQREARETIDHLTKKCACLTNLFEDMRSRWQQAPGEAAQLRKALQDEKAKSAALRRQLDALSRYRGGEQSRPVKMAVRALEGSEDRPAPEDQPQTSPEAAKPKSKRRKKRSISPVDVYLPPVTVPVRIKQFDQKRRKN